MTTATRRSLQVEERSKAPIRSNGNGHARPNGNGHAGPSGNGKVHGAAAGYGSSGSRASPTLAKPRVFVAAENRLLREALSRMLTKNGDIEVITSEAVAPFPKAAQHAAQDSLQKDDLPAPSGPATSVLAAIHGTEILLLSSKGNLDWDLAEIPKVRSATPEALILLIDVSGDETNFLQWIRAGVRGYLPRDASAEDVVEAVKSIHGGKAVCPARPARRCFAISSVKPPASHLRAFTSVWTLPARAAIDSSSRGRPPQQGNRQPLAFPSRP